MTDSEDDLLESIQHNIRKEGTVIHAKGPNINFETSSLLSSTLQMLPGSVNRQKYGQINNDQRSLYYRRETSPMSAYNVSHISRPYFRSFSTRSHVGSVYNHRNHSPVSIRSSDTISSVTASDIVVALKNEHFNEYDQKLLKAAFYKFLKNKSRKRLEHLRNRRIRNNRIRRQCSTDDFGEMASQSSSSSENSISPKIFKDKNNGIVVKTKNVNQVHMENSNQNMPNINHDGEVNEEDMVQTTKAGTQNKLQQCRNNSKDNPIVYLKDRFKTGFQLPSQRFSKSTNGASLSEANFSCNLTKNQVPYLNEPYPRDSTHNIESEDEIFSAPTNNRSPVKSYTVSRKRTIDSNEHEDNPKASKLMKTDMSKEAVNFNDVKNNIKNDFIFAKPQMPIAKLGKVKKNKQEPERLISKSTQPLSTIQETANDILSPISKQPTQLSTKACEDITDSEKRSNNNEFVNTVNDVSKRPSFIKRKLFTQKLDVIEAKIDSNTPQSSPHAVKYVGSKEKTKPRKLASSQSCLSRDVLSEDNNNLLNLLHKIVPADQLSSIKPTNKTDTMNSEGDGAKWDIDSVLSTCNPDEGSETYTDEEILGNENKQNRKSNHNNKAESNVASKEVEEIRQKNNNKTNEQSSRNEFKDGNKNTLNTNQKSFWDTDIESDWENNVFLPQKLNDCHRNKATANEPVNKVSCKNKSVVVNSTAKYTNGKCQKVDAKKITANNCQSIWDTDFESDLEMYGILPHKPRNCKINNTLTNKGVNNEDKCENNKNSLGNSKTKRIINSKSHKGDGNKTTVNNYQKSIWDTDFESDLESCGILPQAKKLASRKIITPTADKKVDKQENCENYKNGAVNSMTKRVINSKCEKIDVNKKTVNNYQMSIWDTDFESDLENYGIMANKLGNCKISNLTATNDKNGDNKKNNASVAVNAADKRVIVVKCHKLDANSITCQKSLTHSVESKSGKSNNATTNKRLIHSLESVKAHSPASIETRPAATKRTPKKVVNNKSSNEKKTKKVQKKNNSPEPELNVSNVSERWLRANRRAKNFMNESKPNSLKTLSTLISHRMTRHQTKILHNSDITSTTQKPNVSTELNISVKSLRPRKKRVQKW